MYFLFSNIPKNSERMIIVSSVNTSSRMSCPDCACCGRKCIFTSNIGRYWQVGWMSITWAMAHNGRMPANRLNKVTSYDRVRRVECKKRGETRQSVHNMKIHANVAHDAVNNHDNSNDDMRCVFNICVAIGNKRYNMRNICSVFIIMWI